MSAAQWERLANEALADAREWKTRARNAEDNARELLTALQAILPLAQAQSDYCDGAYGRDIDSALEAIAKATGGEA